MQDFAGRLRPEHHEMRHGEIDDDCDDRDQLPADRRHEIDSTPSVVVVVAVVTSSTPDARAILTVLPSWDSWDDVICAERGDISGLRVNLIELVI
jgi:hypothetical protein